MNTLSHKAILDKVNNSTLDETRKMVYRDLLTRTSESTNGRTTAQKIQDMTEALAGMSQLLVSREIDDEKTSETINTVCETVNEVKHEVLNLKSSFNSLDSEISKLKEIDNDTTNKIVSLKTEVNEQIQSGVKSKKTIDKVLEFLKNMPWSVTVLGLGICVVLCFRPELADILKMFVK